MSIMIKKFLIISIFYLQLIHSYQDFNNNYYNNDYYDHYNSQHQQHQQSAQVDSDYHHLNSRYIDNRRHRDRQYLDTGAAADDNDYNDDYQTTYSRHRRHRRPSAPLSRSPMTGDPYRRKSSLKPKPLSIFDTIFGGYGPDYGSPQTRSLPLPPPPSAPVVENSNSYKITPAPVIRYDSSTHSSSSSSSSRPTAPTDSSYDTTTDSTRPAAPTDSSRPAQGPVDTFFEMIFGGYRPQTISETSRQQQQTGRQGAGDDKDGQPHGWGAMESRPKVYTSADNTNDSPIRSPF
ncbi:uncharacterized protein LOC128965121 [Oppia nitens]|uniref:uncharacterized protein LOC128965121 n=1 Tax=Oppia nitens TaxID=1686743 RepID=UPI0023DBBEB0|nr:uncharacterized protein LOC128965121 [Oppia nitens]